MSSLLTDVADLAGYAEPVAAPKYLDTLHIAREGLNIHTRLLSVIACGFPAVALERGASSFATALHIRERYAKYPMCNFRDTEFKNHAHNHRSPLTESLFANTCTCKSVLIFLQVIRSSR